jgi:ribosomal protein S4E
MSKEVKTRGQLDAEIMDIIKFRDTGPMYRILYGAFKKRSLQSLDNQQLGKLIELLKKEYGNEPSEQTPR